MKNILLTPLGKPLLTTLLLLLTSPVSSQELFSRYSAVSGEKTRGVEADNNGNLYVVGKGDIELSCFDTLSLENRGSGYLSKLDSIGNVIWRLNFGGDNCWSYGLDIGPEGNIYVTGTFTGSGDFSSTPLPSKTLSAGSRPNIFVLKATPFGEILWAKNRGGSGTDAGQDIVVDSLGNAYITGEFDGVWGSLEAQSVDSDPFVWSLSSSGSNRWVRSIPSFIGGSGKKVVLDNDGNLITVGRIVDIDSRKPTIFIWKHALDGSEIYLRKWAVNNNIYNHGLAADSRNNIYLTGEFKGEIDFDPGQGEYTFDGGNSVYLLKLNKDSEFLWMKNTGRFNAYSAGKALEIDSEDRIYSSGVFTRSLDLNPGADEFIIKTDNSDATNLYIQVLDSTGVFIFGLKNGTGSSQDYENKALDLETNGRVYLASEVRNGSSGAVYAYGNCPVVNETEKTIACRNYTLNGFTIDTDCDIRTTELDTITGCEKISQLIIDIIPKREIHLYFFNGTLSPAFTTSNMQWLNCDNNMAPIPGAVDREFVPDSTGTYAVQITTERGCIDTSECKFVEVMSVSTENSKNRPSTNVFPNPFTERIILNNLPYPITEISIVDLSGKLIFEKEKAKGINEIEISTGKFPKGVFIVFFKNEKGTFRRLIIKN